MSTKKAEAKADEKTTPELQKDNGPKAEGKAEAKAGAKDLEVNNPEEIKSQKGKKGGDNFPKETALTNFKQVVKEGKTHDLVILGHLRSGHYRLSKIDKSGKEEVVMSENPTNLTAFKEKCKANKLI